jgi:hypothetical protein
MLMIVKSVKPEESMHQVVFAQLENSMPVLLNVNHVHTDVAHVKDPLTIVLTVPKTESQPQLVIVLSPTVIIMSKDKLNAQDVLLGVLNVLITLPVFIVT